MFRPRSEPRTIADATVRVFGMDSNGQPINQPARAVEISHHGARLIGLDCWDYPGEVIGVRYGTEKARYRVVWVGKAGTPQQGQVGLLCVESGKYIWGIAPPAQAAAAAAGRTSALQAGAGVLALASAGPSKNNRRRDARFHAPGGVNVKAQGATTGQWAMLHDISMGGCYVETTSPLPIGSKVECLVHSGEYQLTARGHVTVSHRLVGMGIQFTDMSPLNRERLQKLMDALVVTGAEA